MKIPKLDLSRNVKRNILAKWQSNFNQILTFKIKSEIKQWDTSFNENRRVEIILARLRLNCIKEFHLVPRIEGTFPLICTCDGSRQSLKHLFLDCSHYSNQRIAILAKLYSDKKPFIIKSLFEDNKEYCKLIMQYLEDINFITKI